MTTFRPLWISACIIIACMVIWLIVLPYSFIHFWGIDTQQSDNYDFFSGSGPVWVTTFFGSSVFSTLWVHLNCHTDGCGRIGRFPVAGGQYKVCRKHHREIVGHSHKLTTELLRAEHTLHLDRIGRRHESS